MQPTAEQQAIVQAAVKTQDNLLISALAGAAKTTTLELIAKALTSTPILSLAFNKRIMEEMATRLPPNVSARTMNSVGHRVWGALTKRKLVVDTRKTYSFVKEMTGSLRGSDKEEAFELFSDTIKMISRAKLNGYLPNGKYEGVPRLCRAEEFFGSFEDEPSELQMRMVDRAIINSVRLAYEGIIDYDDQVLMPCQPSGTKVAVCHNGEQGYWYKNIENVKVGDEVISFDRRLNKFRGFYNHGSPILDIAKRPYTGTLYEILAGEHKTSATLEHKWLVRFVPDLARKSIFFTYLMYRDGSYKIGMTQVRCVRPGSADGFGLAVRCTMEKAELAWILTTHETLQSAKIQEAIIAAQFGITDKSFESDLGIPVHSYQKINSEMTNRARKCLAFHGRDIRFPFWKPHDTRAFTRNFILESCNLISGLMQVPILVEKNEEPNWQTLYTNETFVENLEVHSLKVARHELYVANKILTHNCLFGGDFPKFPLVLIDEAQDLSPLNHKMLEHLVVKRVIAVGDEHQAIYAFRGAVSDSMRQLESKFGMTRMNLSISFRCPIEIVKLVRKHTPTMQWPEWAKPGQVRALDSWSEADIPDKSAVICRNNAPLFRLALTLLREGRGVKLVGTDLGPSLIKALKRLGAESLRQSEVFTAIDLWETKKLISSRAPASVSDKADCLRVFASFGETLSAAIAYAEHLFATDGPIQLLSGHKAKGLEWDQVFHLDPWRIPSKWAKGASELEQEDNISYVINTRSKDSLTFINMDAMVSKEKAA